MTDLTADERKKQIEDVAKEMFRPDWHSGRDENASYRRGFEIGAEWADANPDPLAQLRPHATKGGETGGPIEKSF